MSAIHPWLVLADTKQLRSFLGLAGYYRNFVRHFGILSKALTNLFKKTSVFVWTSEHDNVFNALKQSLCNSPVLAFPDFTKTFLPRN